MAFPVDILTNVDDESLELTAKEYMSQLPYRNTEYLSLSDSKKIEIGLCNVSFVPLYGTDTTKKLLALFSPDYSNTVVGLYLLDRWWGVEDILKTAEPSRTGLIKVSTLGERIVLYVLNRIVLRNEKSSEDVFFLCHCEHEAAKILWKDGEAIGFYSFKPKGSLCRIFMTMCYQLPVMDTVFVRKCHRGQGHGVKILEDFVGSFRNEYIGLKFPLSEAMYKVCEKYFSVYPADKELLWEAENVGSHFQRTLIAKRLPKLKLKEKDQVVSKLNFEEDDATAPMEIEITKVQETTECSVEIVEETITEISKEVNDIPVTRRGRDSNLKRRGIRENSEERLSENIMRVEDIEAGVESSTEVAAVENLNTFSVKESETALRSSVDTVTATVTKFAELRGSQKEEEQEIEKDIVTATSEGIPDTHLTTAGEIKSQRGSNEECEMVIKENTVEIEGATIGSVNQSQLQSVVDVEIVKMSTGTEEEKCENLEKNKEVEQDEPVCEAEKKEIKQMLDEPKAGKTVSETGVTEQSETHAKSTEKEQAHWDVEITENKERAEDEVMAESGKDLTEENRDDSIGQEKTEAKDEDTVLQQSVEVKDQTEMETDSVTEVLCTEEVLCGQQKQNEAATEVSEPNQTMTNKDKLIEKAGKSKLSPDEAQQVFTKSKLPQKRTSALTPSRRSKRLRHQPAEKDLRTTKSAKTDQQRSKHCSKAMMQDEDTDQSTVEPEHDVSEIIEKIQEAQVENKAEAEPEVEEYKENDMLTVETVSTMDAEITQVEETVDIVPEVSELVEREEIDQEEAPQQSSVEPPEVQESKTTPEEDEETVENSTVMLTLNEPKVVLVDLHTLSPKEASDNHGENRIPEQEEMKHTMSSEQQTTEETMTEEQDGTLDTRSMEEPACTTTTKGYDVAADANTTLEQYKDQEGEPESKTKELVLLSQVEKPEKTDTEQAKEDEQDSYEADKLFPKQGKQTQKKGSIDSPSRSTRLKDPPVDPGVTVRCLRSTLKPVKVTPVRRSTHNKAVIQQVESVEPQVDAKLRTGENPERDEVIAEDVGPEENQLASYINVDETASVECGSSELLKAAGIDDKEKEPQITKSTEEIPLIETEAEENVTENRVEDIKKMENKGANLAGQMDSDIEMSSLAQEVHVQEEEVPVSTERHLRCRTIRVQSPLRGKSRYVQKQKAEINVEHQERHTVVGKNKTETILMTKEDKVDEMDQDVNKTENKEAHFAELEPVEEPNMSRNEYENTSETKEETANVCIPVITTETSMEGLDEMANTNIEEAAVQESSELLMGVKIDDQDKEFQIVDGSEEVVSPVEPGKEVEKDDGTPVEPGKEVEKDDGTPVIKLQRATIILVDLSELSQNTEGEGETSEDPTHSQVEEKLELDEADKSEQELSNLASEEEEQQEEIQTQKDSEKTPEEEKMWAENTVEEHNKLDKQDMTFEGQNPTEDLATMPAEGSLVESNKTENNQNEDEGVSSLSQEEAVQENLEEETPFSTQRSLRRRTIRVQSPPRRKSRRIQKQEVEVFEDKAEIVQIMEKEADEVDQEGAEIDDKEIAPQTSTADAAEKVIALVEAEPEDNVAEKGVEEISKMENKETNLAATKDTGEEESEMGEEANLEQDQNEPLVKNDKETIETEKSMEIDPVVGKEQIYIVGGTTIEENVSQVSLVEAEPDEEEEKDDGTAVIQLQKATVVLLELNKLSQNTGESDTPEVLTHSQSEKKLEQDKPDFSEYQLRNLTSENQEQQEQLQKEEDTEKTHEEDKMEEENTVEEQDEPNKQDMTFERQKPTEYLEGQNDLKATEIVEVYRAVGDVEEAVKSGEVLEKTTTMADKTNINQEAEKDHDTTLKEKQTESDIEMSSLAQEAPETAQEILEEEASVSTERSLRHRTIKIQSPPRRKSRRVQKQEAEAFEDKTRNVPITGKVVEEMHKGGSKVNDKEETLKKSIVEATEVIPLVEADHEDDVKNKGFEDIVMENKKTNLAATKDTDEEAPEMGEEANLEQQENEPLVKNNKETMETEKTIEIDPLVSKEQTYIVGGTAIQIEENVSQVESTETSQSDNERTTRRSLRLSVKSVTSTQKTRKSTRLHKVELEPVKETNMSRNEYEEASATTEETVNVNIPVITVECNLESLDEIANTNVEETTAIEPETSELLMGVETNDKEETSQTVEEVPPIEAEPDEEIEKDDGTLVILQKDMQLLVDLNNLSQNTEGETNIPEVLTHFDTEEQLELDDPYKCGYQLCNLTSEEDKQDMTFEGQKPTDDLEGRNDVKEREIVEEYKVDIDEDVEETVTSGEHPKATTMEDKTDAIQDTENDQDISLKEKQMDSDVEMSSLDQEAPEAAQEILEEEWSVSTERSLRRRTIKIQSPPRRKSRRVQKQVAEVFEDKTGTVPLTGKADDEVHKERAETDDKEETVQKSTAEATENVVSLIEGEPDEDVQEEGSEEINKMENKETNLGNKEAPEMERKEANLEQQENEPFVENEKETAEKSMEMEVSVVNKEQTYIIEETAIQVEEEISQMESSETNENKSERTTRRSLRISEQSVTSTQKTRKSTRLHKAELEEVKEAETSGNEETIVTNVEKLDEDGDIISMSKQVETISDEQETDISNDKGKVDEALPERSTGDEEDETVSLITTTENEILIEIDKTQKVVEGGVQDEEKAEPSQENTDQEDLEKEDVPVPNEQEEEEVSSVQEDAKLLQERENEGATEGVQGSSADVEEMAVKRRTLRKRTTVETAAPRKSKHLRKQEHDDDSEQVKEAITGETESVEVTFVADNVELRSDVNAADFEGSILGEEILQKIQKSAEGTKSDGECNICKDTEPDAGESQEEQKQSRLNKTQTDEDNEEVMTAEIEEEVIEQHLDLESSTNEGFMLVLEVEETSDQEENKADEESRVVMEAPKDIFTSASEGEGEENISDDDEKVLAIEKHVLQSSSTTASTRRKSMRLQTHESQKKTKEDESDSESEVQQTAKQRHQRKRKAITDSTPARRSKRRVRARIV